MDILGRHPHQNNNSTDGVSPPPRPQGYSDPSSRANMDGFTPAPQPAPQPVQPTQPQPAPVPQNHSGHQQGSTDFQQPSQPLNEAPQPQPQVLEPTHEHHRSSKPVILAVITLLIASGLAVAVFFAFRPETEIKSNKVNVPTSSKTNTSSSTTNTADEVDSATSDINKQVEGLNDAQDFADTELSDQSLGL